ncbi:MAG: dihydroxy-acid dehydratase [Desulfobacterales bacterium]
MGHGPCPWTAWSWFPIAHKIVPGMLMAAACLDIPAIFISGGPMLAGKNPLTPAKVDLIMVFEAGRGVPAKYERS